MYDWLSGDSLSQLFDSAVHIFSNKSIKRLGYTKNNSYVYYVINDEPMNVIDEILNDPVMRMAFEIDRRDALRMAAEARERLENSQYSFSIIYWENQKNLLGSFDSFTVDGLRNAQSVLDSKVLYNVGIKEIRIGLNGKRWRTYTFSGNEERSKSYSKIKLIR